MKHHRRWVHIFLILPILFSGLAFSLASVHPVSAQSGSWYVSTLGSDDNACNAPEFPCMTINGAIAKAVPGDTINVAVGKFTGATGMEQVVYINKSITLSGGWDESFTARSGRSTVDGSGVRRGIEIVSAGSPYTIAVINHFTILNGLAENSSGGGIFIKGSTLTLSNSVVRHNTSQKTGGGIYNDKGSILTISNTTISENSAGKPNRIEGHGGGIDNHGGTVNIDSSTISGNMTVGSSSSVGYGSGIYTDGTVILNNSTVSGNASGYQGIDILGGTLTLNNSTVTGNLDGISLKSGNLRLRNSIVAGNSVGDCRNDPTYGTITSQGYNLIGNGVGCSFRKATGDLVGKRTNPIDPRLGLLQNNGGPTFTHALLWNSPAINAGNPAEPGSGGNACLPSDQRGVNRLEESICDIGAYEVDIPIVVSIKRQGPALSAASSVNFLVTFSEPVNGVELAKPFSDFALTTIGMEGAAITAVSGSENVYIVTVKTGSWSENATIRLDVIDDDSILDASGKPLSGPGAGNGNFTRGQVYRFTKTVRPLFPNHIVMDKTPTFQWTSLGGAEGYQLVVQKDRTVVYTVKVLPNACTVNRCYYTPATKPVNPGLYTWKVRAQLGGVWQKYGPAMAFEFFIPRPGLWRGRGMEFYITPNGLKVDNFAIYINVNGCGSYKVTRSYPLAIQDKKFSFTGSFYADGTFVTPTKASGTLGLKGYHIPYCGWVSGGPYSWTAVWKNNSQPTPVVEEPDGLEITLIPDLGLLPDLQLPFDAFTVEPVE